MLHLYYELQSAAKRQNIALKISLTPGSTFGATGSSFGTTTGFGAPGSTSFGGGFMQNQQQQALQQQQQAAPPNVTEQLLNRLDLAKLNIFLSSRFLLRSGR